MKSASRLADDGRTNTGKEQSRKLGLRLRRMRQMKGWKLSDLAQRSGIAVSTLSKIENGALALTYDRLIQVATAFDLSLSEFISDVHEAEGPRPVTPLGRFSLATTGSGQRIETDAYVYEYLCTKLRSKVMTPARALVKARTLEEFGPLSRHEGEEFVLVLSGRVTVHTELYNPETLEVGEGVYIDSGMGHAFLRASDEDSWILFVNAFGTADEQHWSYARTTGVSVGVRGPASDRGNHS